jgi:hypothetical protein
MKKTLALVMSLVMAATMFFALPFSAQAANDYGFIRLKDEFVAWGLNTVDEDDVLLFEGASCKYEEAIGTPMSSYKGLSYNVSTNTLTINNLKQNNNCFWFVIGGMGNLTVNLVGTSEFVQLDLYDTNLTFTGSGTLTINPKMTWTHMGEKHTDEYFSALPVNANDATITVGGSATVKVASPAETFLFSSTKTLTTSNLIKYAKASTTPKWASSVNTEEAWDEDQYIRTPYVYHKFPASSLMYRTDAGNSVSDYWVISHVGYYGDTDCIYAPLFLNSDGLWVEDWKQGFSWDGYNFHPYTTYDDLNYYFDSSINIDASFANYSDFSSIPKTLVTGSNATALLDKAHPDSPDIWYKSGNQDFAMMDSLAFEYRNSAVNPSEPAAPSHSSEYAYEMFYVMTQGNTQYLKFCETILQYESENYSTARASAKTAAKGLGYELQYTHHPEVKTYYYSLTNSQINFTPAPAHTHSYSWVVTKAATCTTAGTKAYKCSCGNVSKTETIAATGHSWNAGTVTKAATYTATGVKTYTCTKCKATKTETIAKKKKKDNPLKVSAVKATVKYSKLKKKNQTLKVEKVLKVTKAKGTVTYKKTDGNKKITIDKKSGKVTVKKGLKKGTYKVKIKVTAAGTTSYKSAYKTVTVKVVVE